MYKNKSLAYIFIVPMMLFFIVFLLYPFCKNIYDSFFRYESALDTNPVFYGFNNYRELIGSTTFLLSLKNTIVLIVLVIIFQVGIALLLALLVSAINKCAQFYKITFFLPIVISATALGLLFNLFYDYSYGMLNQLLEVFNLDPVNWMDANKPFRVFILVMIPVLWQYVGFYFVIFLTGLANISDEICEAAEMDGCSGFKQMLYIKIPMLRNITNTVLVLAVTGALKVFDLPYIIAKDGYGDTHLLGTYMYYKAFSESQIGQAAAFAVIIVMLGIILSAISNVVFKESEDL